MPWFKKILLVGFYVIGFMYVATALSAYYNTIHAKVFTFLSLIYPYTCIALLIVILLSIIFRFKKHWFIFLLCLVFGYKNFFATTALHIPSSFNFNKPNNSFRLLSWNVNDFVDCQKQWDTVNTPRRNILAFIKKTNADIIALQDVRDYIENDGFYSNIKYMQDTLGYKYYYFSQDDPFGVGFYNSAYGAIIFSRFPITDSGRVAYQWPHYPEHLQYATITLPNKKNIQLYNTHFRSMQLKTDNQNPNFDYTFVQDDTAIMFNRNKIHKLRYYDSVHVQQAYIVQQQLQKASHAAIFCADLNAVPSSYVYHTVKGNFKDAFLQHGLGWGATYPNILPSIRIDVVLHHKQLQTLQYYSKPIPNSSDHYPVLVDFALP